jgi:hypothetical protein
MESEPTRDGSRSEDLTALFRRTIHAANNELMSIIQECELALVKDDPTAMRDALAFTIDHVMEISRLHGDARCEILDSLERISETEAPPDLPS